MKLLLTADLHIGRSSSGVGSGLTREQCRASQAWERIVDLAINERVAAVCIGGDLIDKNNCFFEARGPISRGLRKLGQQGIRTIAVAGNHDYEVLRAVADSSKGDDFQLTLLGRDGVWEETTLQSADGQKLRVVGWSFESTHHRSDPVLRFPALGEPHIPTLGIVHGDLGMAESDYAPLSLEQLQSKPVGGWLLGHIHQCKLHGAAGGPWVLYPGSPQALDPGEHGSHGVWIVDVANANLGSPRFEPISSVRYEKPRIDVSSARDEGELNRLVLTGLQAEASAAKKEGGEHLERYVADVQLVGTTAIGSLVRECAKRLQVQLGEDGDIDGAVGVRVRSAMDGTSTELDLHELAKGTSMPGLVAKLILTLSSTEGSDDARQLLKDASSAASALGSKSKMLIGDTEVSYSLQESDAREMLISAARELLGTLTTEGKGI